MNLREYLIAAVVIIGLAATTYQWLTTAIVNLVEQTFNPTP